MAIKFLVRENQFQSSVKASTADVNKEAAKLASDKVRRQQTNNNARKAVVNDGGFEGANVTLTKGSNLVTNVMNALELNVGSMVTGQGIPPDTTIVAVSGNTVTLSNKAQTGSMNADLRAANLVQRIAFTPWEALVQAIMFSNEAAYVN
jgi:hypothetical protein